MPSNKSKKGDQAEAAPSKPKANGSSAPKSKVQPTKPISQPAPTQALAPLPPLDHRPNSAPPSNPAENEDGTSRERRPSNAEPLGRIRENHWVIEQHVENVHVKFLYQPHTITALGIVMLVVLMVTFTINSDENTMLQNSQTAAWLVAFFVLVLGMLVFPSGPFIRPHPIVWRVVFGVGVLYEVLLLVLLSQKRADARQMLTFFYPELNQPLKERAYADDCSVNWGTLKPAIFDLFFVSHFVGWILKALMLRDYVLCWSISIEWELIEIFFTHMLPNFAECWWDQWVLDVLLSNGIGIYVGHKLCEYLEFKQYTWGGVESIPTFYGKVKRTVLQFTPERWIHVEWEATSNVKRFVAIQLLILGFHAEELNAFFLKHILWIPPSNPLNVLRLVVWFFIGVPCLRQIYIYITDSTCKRLGAQAWMCVLILVTELCIIFKFSTGLFPNALPENVKQGAVAFFVIYFIVSALLLIRGKHQHEHAHGTVVTIEDGKKKN